MSIVAPARLFAAARTLDWEDRKYSPTLRVWLFLVAVMMFLQFMWANPDSYMGQGLGAALASNESQDPILKAPETLELALQRYVFVYPIVLLLSGMMIALVIRIWGKGTTTVTRIRLFFAAVLPGMFVTLATTPLVAFVPAENVAQYFAGVFITIFLADFLTTWRGLAPIYKTGARTWRAVLLATVNQLVYVMVSVIAVLIMVAWLAASLGVDVSF